MTTRAVSDCSVISRRFDSVDLAKTIAVLGVFAYHSPVFELTSGFLGVDLFLVVTGYLTAASIQKAGPIVFFIKRLIRVWPSLLLTLILTFIIFQYFMYYSEIRQLSRDSVLANTFLANFGTYYLTGGYFDKSTQASPLFHMWSISLEIQLWFMFTVILQIARKNGLALVCFFGSLSFFYTAFFMLNSEDLNEFYLLPFGRFWEAALGYCVFFQSVRFRIKSLTLLALILLLVGIMVIDVSKYRVLWYLYVLLSLFILRLDFSLKGSLGEFVRFVSRRTYGIYLIHVPLIVLFDTYLELNATLSFLLVAMFTFLYANLSYKYLEK